MFDRRTEFRSEYCAGGLHPIDLGDCFCEGRYEVIRKLGYGSFSTVWLAMDLNNKRPVALKFLVAKAAIADREISIMDRMKECHGARDGSENVLTLRDRFVVDGPNGLHQCLAFDVMGPSLSGLLLDKPWRKSSPDMLGTGLPYVLAKSVLRQVLSGLRYMHHLGIAHGDLQPGNILCALKDLDHVEISRLRQEYVDWDEMGQRHEVNGNSKLEEKHNGPSYSNLPGNKDMDTKNFQDTSPQATAQDHNTRSTESVKLGTNTSARANTIKGVRRIEDRGPDRDTHQALNLPTFITYTQVLGEFLSLDFESLPIKLSDFGNSFFFEDPPANPTVPIALRAPELVVGNPITKEQDIWALGCLIYQLITGYPLFPVYPPVFAIPKERKADREPRDPDPLDVGPDDDHMLAFTEILGTIPQSLRDRWQRSSLFFDSNGKVVNNSVGEEDAEFDSEYEPSEPIRVSLMSYKPDEMDEQEAKSLIDLLERMMQYEPLERLSLDMIAAHPFFLNKR